MLLRPEVISEPEITVTKRTSDDQCLVLARDGILDVISNETACHVTRQCLEYGNLPPPASSPATATTAVRHEVEPCCSSAAMVLARLAIARWSADNISIVVVDLKQSTARRRGIRPPLVSIDSLPENCSFVRGS